MLLVAFARFPSHLPTFGLHLQLLLQSTGLFPGYCCVPSLVPSPWLRVAPSILPPFLMVLMILKVTSLLYCGSSCLPSTVWPILTVSQYSLMGPNLLLWWDLPWSVVILPFRVAFLFSFLSFLLNWEPSLVHWVMLSFFVYPEPSFIPTSIASCSAWLFCNQSSPIASPGTEAPCQDI